MTTNRKSERTRPMLMVNYKGKDVALMTLARRLRLNYHVLHSRIFRSKWPVQQAIDTPLFVPRKYD